MSHPNKSKPDKTTTGKSRPDKPKGWAWKIKWLRRKSSKQQKEKQKSRKPNPRRNSPGKETSPPSKRDNSHSGTEMPSKLQTTSSDTANTSGTLSTSIRAYLPKADSFTPSPPHSSTLTVLPWVTVAVSSLRRTSPRRSNACVPLKRHKSNLLTFGRIMNCSSPRALTYNNSDMMFKTSGLKESKSMWIMELWRKCMRWRMGKMWTRKSVGWMRLWLHLDRSIRRITIKMVPKSS